MKGACGEPAVIGCCLVNVKFINSERDLENEIPARRSALLLMSVSIKPLVRN